MLRKFSLQQNSYFFTFLDLIYSVFSGNSQETQLVQRKCKSLRII